MALSRRALEIDVEREIDEIAASIRSTVGDVLRLRGGVVGVSGGVDSATCAALCARALGAERVLAVLMPDDTSRPESIELGREVVAAFGLRHVEVDITPILDAFGCSTEQTAAIRTAVADFGPGWRFKLVLPSILAGDRLNVSRLVVADPAGETRETMLGAAAYRRLVAATNYKQRTRTALLYFHADAEHFAVCGTPNRLEYDQGFFVKGGDGLADLKPIAHLYKTQVRAIARQLGVPASVVERPATTDTFSLEQSQEEFYFALPADDLDLCLYGHDHAVPPEEVAAALGLTAAQVRRVYADIVAKRRSTRRLHLSSVLVRPVESVAEAPGS